MADEVTNEEQSPQDDPQGEKPKWHKWGLTKRFGSGQGQPSNEAKRAGWVKRKRNRELAQQLLGMKFVGLVPIIDEMGRPIIDESTGKPMLVLSDYAEKLKNYFGLTVEQIEDMDNETAIRLRQIGMAIEKGDNESARQILEAAYGKPREFIDLGDDENERPIIQINVINQFENPLNIAENERDQTQHGGDADSQSLTEQPS